VADLTRRSRQEEQMDEPGLDPATYERVLHDLARVNRWTFTAWPSIAFISRAIGSARRLHLLDIGFGDGDILRAIGRWARRRGIEAELIGVDLNEKSLQAARAATPPDLRIDYRAGDYVDQAGPFDFIICTQVAHHMTDEQLMTLLRFMESEARLGWLVCDLHRHGFAYWTFPLLARLLRVERIVREDGQLSIARSFRPDEWKAALQQAGIAADQVRIVRRFAFRLCVERLRRHRVGPGASASPEASRCHRRAGSAAGR
jgi:2-polyprenyl-3-methyl-5-hydroxy-6-metoxy-1,4-benzoquinol methylase